jgi:hypothetical protein
VLGGDSYFYVAVCFDEVGFIGGANAVKRVKGVRRVKGVKGVKGVRRVKGVKGVKGVKEVEGGGDGGGFAGEFEEPQDKALAVGFGGLDGGAYNVFFIKGKE